MNYEKNSLTIAYIAFLIVSVLVYIASLLLNFEFGVWKQIIAAATVASYCFSLTGILKAQVTICKSIILICENLLTLSLKQDKLFKKTTEELKKLRALKNTIEESELEYPSIIGDINDLIQYNSNKIENTQRYIFVVTALGYLLFFCIIAFEEMYNKISTSQEILTLLAFIAMLLSDYISEHISNKYSKRFEDLCSRVQTNVNSLKESYNIIQNIKCETK